MKNGVKNIQTAGYNGVRTVIQNSALSVARQRQCDIRMAGALCSAQMT